MSRAALVLVAVVLAGCGGNSTAHPSSQPGAVAPRCTSFYPIPSGCLFGLHGVTYVVESAYAYEASLLGGVPPVADHDYMLGYGVQQHFHLAGGWWDRYRFIGMTDVLGSGCVREYTAPNGGRMAFLHTSCPSGFAQAEPEAEAPPLTVILPLPVSGDEATALSTTAPPMAVEASQRPTLGGGTWVGWSRWPTWYQYGNGSCCQADAHLCLVLDAAARDFLFRIAWGRDPNPFPVRRWHLAWLKHRWLGRYGGRHTTYPHAPGRPYAYTIFRFPHGRLWCWPHYNRCKATK